MNEIEETIKILDKLAGWEPGKYTSGKHEATFGVLQWYLASQHISITLLDDAFTITEHPEYPDFGEEEEFISGFELLEKLAKHPEIATKLAEPTK